MNYQGLGLKQRRLFITFGRSMENAKDIAIKNGLIKDPSIFIDTNQAKDLKKHEIIHFNSSALACPDV